MACFDDPNMTADIAARWQLALADAGVSHRDAILHVFEGINEPGQPGAMAVEPSSPSCDTSWSTSASGDWRCICSGPRPRFSAA
jgi:hypothetical protein